MNPGPYLTQDARGSLVLKVSGLDGLMGLHNMIGENVDLEPQRQETRIGAILGIATMATITRNTSDAPVARIDMT